MDEADIAQRDRELYDRLALQRQLNSMPQGESAAACEACGGVIPEERRQAAPGCTRCILCQTRIERRQRGRG